MKVKHKQLVISPKNPRSFLISGATDTIKPITIKGKIVSLVTENYSIDVGESFPVGRRMYKVNIIKEQLVNSVKTYEVSTASMTKSSMFVFPMLGGSRRLYLFNELFVNCFIGDQKHKDCIVLLYRFSGNSTFLKFEQALSQFSTFVETYDPSPEFVAFVFKIPTQHEKDFYNFKTGKYSELGGEYKSKLLDFHGFDVHGDLAQIIYRSERRRLRLQQQLGVELPLNAELHSIIDLEDEIFNPDIYITKKGG